MLKLAGSICILAGGALVWWLLTMERRRRRNTLQDLMVAFRKMGEEIRIMRTPLPRLMEALAADCTGEAADLFRSTGEAARQGKGMTEIWRQSTDVLPLSFRDREIIRGLDLQGDEEKVCKEISLVVQRLAGSAASMERTGPEETRRTTALCFSGAALLVILLI